MCLNFVQGGRCYATGEKCLLGTEGSTAKNSDAKCPLHGRFDVWITGYNSLLISDIGFPPDEPKQCLALGAELRLANAIATRKSRELGTSILTTRRRCSRCGISYWISDHSRPVGLVNFGRSYLCPTCIRRTREITSSEGLGVPCYWCG